MKKSVIIVLVITVVAFIVLFSSCYTVEESEYAYVVRFSKVEQVIDKAGLHFKIPFVDSVQYFPKNIQLYDLAPSDVLTSDSKADLMRLHITLLKTSSVLCLKILLSLPALRMDVMT